MASQRNKSTVQITGWVTLGVVLAIFLLTYLTVHTRYSPTGTLVLLLLISIMILLDVLQSHLSGKGRNYVEKLPILTWVKKYHQSFWKILSIALLLSLGDIVLTTYAVSRYGATLERNSVVAFLLSTGDVYTWAGQQLTPLLITGLLFALVEKPYTRTSIVFYVLATAALALVTVVNNVTVLVRLSV